MKKTILITGASTGIGKVTAIHFAKNGWNVAATMRSPEKDTELKSIPGIKLYTLDVMDQASIDSAIQSTINEFGKIDVLFNNAGYALIGAFEAMTEAQIKRQFDTNVFGVMNVTRSILPHFRERKDGTIITTSSMGGRLTFPLYSAYHGTKFAIEGFMESLQFELKPFNIKVKNIEPGAIKTDFYSRSIEIASMKPYEKYIEVANGNMMKVGETAPGPQVVAEKVFTAATDGKFKLRYPVGNNAPALLFMRWLLPLKMFMGIVRSQVEKGMK
jgi:NADP-dependent 3-hydroxy acid dehydrogenase YdfG